MTNAPQNMNKPSDTEQTAIFQTKIKEAYPKLSDDDVKLYDGKRDQFFVKLQEKQSVSRADGEKKMQEIEKSCGCSSEKTDASSTQKSDATKAA